MRPGSHVAVTGDELFNIFLLYNSLKSLTTKLFCRMFNLEVFNVENATFSLLLMIRAQSFCPAVHNEIIFFLADLIKALKRSESKMRLFIWFAAALSKVSAWFWCFSVFTPLALNLGFVSLFYFSAGLSQRALHANDDIN